MATPHHQIEEFIERLQQAASGNLESVSLYGSAASHDADAYSDVNLICFLNNTSYASLAALRPAMEWWTGQHHPVPLLVTPDEFRNSVDVFSIEFLDMQRNHRLLFGPEVIGKIHIPMHYHRSQVEYELRARLFNLRKRMLETGDDPERLWEVMLRTVSSFLALFRHSLLALGEPLPDGRRQTVERIRARFTPAIDITSLQHLLDIREKKANTKDFDARAVAGKYLATIELVTAAVDQALDDPREP